MDRRMIEDLVRMAYSTRDAGNINGTLELFHHDAKFELAGSRANSQIVGSAEGQEQIRANLVTLVRDFEFVKRDIVSLHVDVDGQSAVVHTRCQLKFVPKDKTVTTDIADLWKFRDGKVLELIEFVDTATINDMVRG
jgi:ketosteroid isomerase-like protein